MLFNPKFRLKTASVYIGVAVGLGIAGADALMPQQVSAQAVTAQSNPKQVPKYANLLPNPLAPAFIWQPDSPGGTTYTLSIDQFSQSLGPGTAALTTLWGYGKAGQPATFPGRTFEVNQFSPITFTYVNNLAGPAVQLPL